MNSRSPHGRLRDALLRVGERRHVPEADLRTAVEDALSELAEETLGERSRVRLVTLGSEDHSWGRNLGLRLADYDVGLPDLLWKADVSELPSQVGERCPALGQDEWEAALLVCKLILMALESEPEPVLDDAVSVCLPRPARAAARERFCQSLVAIAKRADLQQNELTAQLHSTLLDFASETPDNQQAVQHIAVLPAHQPQSVMRICLSRSGISLAQVLLRADGCPVPDSVLDEFPDLNQREWNAVIQVAGLTLLAFEGELVGGAE
ncbi:hypothetical protein [Streptomyces sp. ISID311]|uniref:hypothetical protein n=1 Tax=Streptomyces sp. ISID311 TaxID=2601673 RepID=UPI0011BD3DDC|nr:hypothetical protein [Streptomyces sp. ISID311]TXC96846.1 hypothetical protein FS847_17135 [Streptomyces sp. ISID311]